jgi:hypothetical protein
MNFKWLLLLPTILMVLTGCAQNVALLGPAITIGTTGNVMQAGIQYGTNETVKKRTGKDALTYISDVVEKDNNKKKFNKKFTILVEERIKKTRTKLNFVSQ